MSDIVHKPKLSDNFFQIGGNSINAVMAVTRINQHFPLSTEWFLEAKTLQELLYKMSDMKACLGKEISIQEDIMVNV